MPQQTRVVIRDEVLDQGERLLGITKLGSLTELIAVMFSRYGRHLEQTWEVIPISSTYAQAEPSPETGQQTITPVVPDSDFRFGEPLIGL
jgi:hypothetical protein